MSSRLLPSISLTARAPSSVLLPTSAEAVVNCRILPDETREGTQKALEALIQDPRVAITASEDFGFGPQEDVTGPVPDAIRKVAARLWPTARTVTSMGTGATDSRHLRAAGIHAYGISTSAVVLDDVRKGFVAHGPDERRPAKWIGEGTRYLREVVLEIAR